MSKFIRLLLQIPLVLFILLLLLLAIYSQRDGFKPFEALGFVAAASFIGVPLLMTSLIGSAEIYDEEWKKKHLSGNSPLFVWGQRMLLFSVSAMVLASMFG